MGIENRIHERKPIKCRVVLVTENEKHKIPGMTIDISLGGAGLLVDENLPMGQKCMAHFRFPVGNGFSFLAIDSSIVYTVLVSNTSQYRIGLKFDSVTPDTESFLKKILR